MRSVVHASSRPAAPLAQTFRAALRPLRTRSLLCVRQSWAECEQQVSGYPGAVFKKLDASPLLLRHQREAIGSQVCAARRASRACGVSGLGFRV